MSIIDIQHAALDDGANSRTSQAAMLTSFAAFQSADQALTQATYVGENTAAQATARSSALTAFKALAAALT